MELLEDNDSIFIDSESYMYSTSNHKSYEYSHYDKSNLYYYVMVPDIVIKDYVFYKLKVLDYKSNNYYILNLGYGYQIIDESCSDLSDIKTCYKYVSGINTSYYLISYNFQGINKLFCIRVWLEPSLL